MPKCCRNVLPNVMPNSLTTNQACKLIFTSLSPTRSLATRGWLLLQMIKSTRNLRSLTHSLSLSRSRSLSLSLSPSLLGGRAVFMTNNPAVHPHRLQHPVQERHSKRPSGWGPQCSSSSASGLSFASEHKLGCTVQCSRRHVWQKT